MKYLKFVFLILILLMPDNLVKGSDSTQNNQGIDGTSFDTLPYIESRSSSFNLDYIYLDNGYKYDVLHNKYFEKLYNNETVYIYFDITNTNTRISDSVKRVVSQLTNIGSNKVKLYTVKPNISEDKLNIVKVKYDRDDKCGSDGWACANSKELYYSSLGLSYMTGNQVTDMVMFHEMLHVFGLDHSPRSYGNTNMSKASAYDGYNFSYTSLSYDMNFWKMMNNPYESSYQYSYGVKVAKYKKFLNSITIQKHTYESSGNYWKESIYYSNGKQVEKVRYDGTSSANILSIHTYESTGKYWNKSTYFENGVRKKEIFYNGEADNQKLKEIEYASDGETIINIIYY
ncbi:MAG: hypothetical protein ACK5K7_01675 [Bacilli bacterium]